MKISIWKIWFKSNGIKNANSAYVSQFAVYHCKSYFYGLLWVYPTVEEAFEEAPLEHFSVHNVHYPCWMRN